MFACIPALKRSEAGPVSCVPLFEKETECNVKLTETATQEYKCGLSRCVVLLLVEGRGAGERERLRGRTEDEGRDERMMQAERGESEGEME